MGGSNLMLMLVISLLLLGTAQGYRHYQDELPNGDLVPHPCKPNYFWRGLGHKNPLGGGPRNPFGKDFARFHQWNYELCMMDSDGDGLTNGQELGDPDCTWTKGTNAKNTKGITHPGVCDPWGSPQCEAVNKDVSCETGEFICEGINDPDVFNVTFRFPPSKVPASETSYMCFTFELDMLDPNTDYHLVATKPFIDNPNVMHHITVSGCNAASQRLDKPELCNMASEGCQSSLGLWTLGLPGECIYREAGFKIGPKAGIPRINMQHHWTNPELRTDYMDSSGMTLYITSKLRPYNANYFSTGNTHLVIPPNMEKVVKTSTCSSKCTRKIMTGPIKLMTGLNHMHYLGYQQNVEHFRDGIKIRDLTPDQQYSYDNPINHEYDPPHEMRPGDELETTCVFKSLTRSTTAMYGEGTYDEMCFGIFTYFPAENLVFPTCITWDELELCDYDPKSLSFHGCRFDIMFNNTHPKRREIISKILNNCNFYGECRRECPAAIAEVMSMNECFGPKLVDWFTDILRIFAKSDVELAKFLSGFQSCSCPLKPDDPDKLVWPTAGSAGFNSFSFVMIASAALVSAIF